MAAAQLIIFADNPPLLTAEYPFGAAPLNASGQIPMAALPTGVSTGLIYYGTVALDNTTTPAGILQSNASISGSTQAAGTFVIIASNGNLSAAVDGVTAVLAGARFVSNGVTWDYYGDAEVITTDQLAAEAVTTAKIAPLNITSALIADGAVLTVKILDANVTTAKLADNAVTTVKITDANVTLAKMAPNSVGSGNIVDGSVLTAKIADANVTTVKIADGNVTTAKIAGASVTLAKMAPNSVGSGNIVDGSVLTAKIADANVTTAKILDGNVTTAKLADGGVTTAKIADANVTLAKMAPSSVGTSNIVDANVTTAKIADANVTTAKIADVNVTTAKLADNAVTTVKILDANVTTAKIADLNVTTAKLADNAVTTAKIADANVTSDKLVTYSTAMKLYAPYQNMTVVQSLTGGGNATLTVGYDTSDTGNAQHSYVMTKTTTNNSSGTQTFRILVRVPPTLVAWSANSVQLRFKGSSTNPARSYARINAYQADGTTQIITGTNTAPAAINTWQTLSANFSTPPSGDTFVLEVILYAARVDAANIFSSTGGTITLNYQAKYNQ